MHQSFISGHPGRLAALALFYGWMLLVKILMSRACAVKGSLLGHPIFSQLLGDAHENASCAEKRGFNASTGENILQIERASSAAHFCLSHVMCDGVQYV